MKKTTALNPISTPLNSTTLIEASAGTGKTYTMASLYLRLLLQAGQNNFPQPLTVEQILVVTFTEAATQELKERIRRRIHFAKQQLNEYRQHRDKSVFMATDNAILAELVDDIEDLELTVQRLHFAEQNMDLAAIYTIHGFCRRMLMQYAFNSGVNFELELLKDESELLLRLSNDFWRRHFYTLSLPAATFIDQKLGSPQQVLAKIKRHLTQQGLKLPENRPHFFTMPLADFIQQYIEKRQERIIQLKQVWLNNRAKIEELVLNEINRDYPRSTPKRLKRNPYNTKNTPTWLNGIYAWATDESAVDIPDTLMRFSQSTLQKNAEEGAMPLADPLFEQIDRVAKENGNGELYEQVILYHYIQGLNQALSAYKNNHNQSGFDDLLRLLKQALYAERGDELAQLIRSQYPFAMIDEFQDTDSQQYQIFHKIYMQEEGRNSGFIMIGDPKQAIYKFRGADIFTYLKAAKQAAQRFTLDKNYRSETHLVQAVNALFDFQQNAKNPPFIYQDIEFTAVEAKEDQARFILSQQVQAPLACYIGDYDKTRMAQLCASSVQHWLTQAKRGEAYFHQNVLTEKDGLGTADSLQAKNIAVLVRNRYEADLVKQALLERGISSVYLSDRSNVFDSQEAKELVFILTACLNPFSERNILNALSTTLFAFTSAQILRIKQDESLLENWVNRFEHYQKIWQRQGVLPMLYQLLLDNDGDQPSIPERLLALPNGERRLTDLLHLAELLQQATPLNESEAALLRWFENQIQGGVGSGENDKNEQQIRLESEQELVKLVTIHKSKGLEYDLVWLPFIGLSNGVRKQNGGLVTYFDQQTQEVYWDFAQTHQYEAQKEQLAEEMRLLYVALTRAKYQLSLILPPHFEKGHWSALLYALTQGEIGEQPITVQSAETLTYLEQLQQRIGEEHIAIYQPHEISEEKLAPTEPNDYLQAAEFHGRIEQNWTLSSFTALGAMHDKNKRNPYYQSVARTESAVENFSVFDQAADYDNPLLTERERLSDMPLSRDWQDFPPAYTPIDFPNGIQVGIALHGLLEKLDFTQGVKSEYTAKLAQNLQLDEAWLAPMQQWLNQVLHTPLLVHDSGLTLACLPPHSCLKEMQFYLKLGVDFSVARFNRILQQHRFGSGKAFLFDDIQGMVRGFIDLVFIHQNKYYLLDYKSNLLGNRRADYAQEELMRVMETNHYDLQYLLYILALHRYLQKRLADYHYETHFGGAIYTFLRGMNGENADYGVFFHKPDWALIQALEALFYA